MSQERDTGSSADELLESADPPPRPARFDDLERRKRESDLGLRRVVGYGALTLMALQIATADVAFYLYGASNSWDIPVAAINGWLAATVIQVVSIVLVITRYLFPSGKGS
jgi:hypothetical protein